MTSTYSEFEQFVDDLNAKQVRALASQIGLKTWATAPVTALRAVLRASEAAEEIWTNVYQVAS